MPRVRSMDVSTAPSIGSLKLGQPVPLSDFPFDSNSGWPPASPHPALPWPPDRQSIIMTRWKWATAPATASTTLGKSQGSRPGVLNDPAPMLSGLRLNQLVEVRLSAVRASPSPLVPRHITRLRHCRIDVVPSSVIGAHKHNLLTASGPSQPADSGDFSLMVLGTSRISQ